MNCKKVEALLFIAFVMAALVPLHAQREHSAKRGQQAPAAEGDKSAASSAQPSFDPNLSITQAKAMLEDALKKRFVGTIKADYSRGVRTTYVLSETTDINVRTSGFAFSAPYVEDGVAGRPHYSGNVVVNFRSKGLKETDHRSQIGPEGYLGVYRPDLGKTTTHVENQRVWGHDKVQSPTPFFSVGYLPDPEHAVDFFQNNEQLAIFAWTDEAAAREFADAFNRLLYAAQTGELDPEFIAAAKAWRESSVKPPLAPEADRERILAENALEEKAFASAVQHYEAAVEIQPMWPAGWFNLAMIYGELKQYSDASFAMRHYLELAPNAPDAKNAREQMIIWEDKAK